jgi:hypothetical protein
MPRRDIITLKDLVDAGCLQIGDIVYNMAHNSLTGKRDKLEARLIEGYVLSLIGGAGTGTGGTEDLTFKSINEFIRYHFNEKIMRGESTRVSSAANAWLCTYKGDGTCFKDFKEFIRKETPIPVADAKRASGGSRGGMTKAARQRAHNYVDKLFGLLEKYGSNKLDVIETNRRALIGLLEDM